MSMLAQSTPGTSPAADPGSPTSPTSATPSEAPGSTWWSSANDAINLDTLVDWMILQGPRTALILIIAAILYALLSRGLRVLEKRSRIGQSNVATLRIVIRWVFVLLTVAALLQEWGVLQNVWAAATTIVALVAIGFVAVWSVLSNVLCSFVLLAARPFRIGEQIAFVGEEVAGRVEQITLLYTSLREDDGSQVLVPNNQFLQKTIRRVPGGRQRSQNLSTEPVEDPTPDLVDAQ